MQLALKMSVLNIRKKDHFFHIQKFYMVSPEQLLLERIPFDF